MNILCVEDEKVIAQYIEKLLAEILKPNSYHFFHAEDLEDAESILQERDIDLLLLDLNLHGQSGFLLLSRMVSKSFNTIIISANVDQALKAFEYGVMDFVAKPFDKARLEQAIERVKINRTAGIGAKYLCVKQTNKLIRIAVSDIQYIKGSGGYSELHMNDKSVLLHDKNLEKLLALLPQEHVRIHKSYIVDVRKIVAINNFPGSKYEAQLLDQTTLPVSRQKVQHLKQQLLLG